jgi:phosphoribosyl-ATP pyrophosphohydrolase/phosphoribosyl-AMP cyclohydrolase/histidinol dehydrogenase
VSTTLCVSHCPIHYLSIHILTNYPLATYGYAKQYSGVNLGSFLKHITSSNLTADGLLGLSKTVETLAAVEGLEAHKRAVSIRVAQMQKARS